MRAHELGCVSSLGWCGESEGGFRRGVALGFIADRANTGVWELGSRGVAIAARSWASAGVTP